MLTSESENSMNPHADQTAKSVELDWYAEDETVIVTPRNQRRFEIQKDRAIRALQQEQDKVGDLDQTARQFNLLLERLANWIEARKEKILRGILTLRDGKLLFLVIQETPEYDEDFEDDLSALDVEIANDADLNLIGMDVLALPPASQEGLQSFVNEGCKITYDGHRSRSHRPSEPESCCP